MRNTTKLKHLLQLYVVSLDIDMDENIHLTLVHKTTKNSATFLHKIYSVVVGKAFIYMMKEIKHRTKGPY